MTKPTCTPWEPRADLEQPRAGNRTARRGSRAGPGQFQAGGRAAHRGQSRAALDSPKSKPERRAVDPQQPHDSPAGADLPAPSELENSTMANKATSPNPATDNEVAAPSTTPPDPFNLESLLLPQNYNETLGVKKVLRVVPVRKPNNQDYNRVHPGKEYRGNFAMIDLKDDRETYLVAGADLIAELESELVRVTLYTAINRQGVVFCGRSDCQGPTEATWCGSSARLAAEDAMKSWTRVSVQHVTGRVRNHHRQVHFGKTKMAGIEFRRADLDRVS